VHPIVHAEYRRIERHNGDDQHDEILPDFLDVYAGHSGFQSSK
jgi:hypothetical protein